MKYFVASDIHSFFTPFYNELMRAGFDENNENHKLIICGDCFDRGDESHSVFRYLMHLSLKNKVILIRGNHEDLLEELLDSMNPGMHDYSNGTVKTINELGGAGEGYCFEDCCIRTRKRLKTFLSRFVNYYETMNYIFVHSFVPLNRLDDMPRYYTRGRIYEKNPNWRDAPFYEWTSARWDNPFKLANNGFLPDKTLVFGHWHTSWPRAHYDEQTEFESDSNFDIYFGEGYIGIDGCCAHSGKINILVLEDDELVVEE